MTLKIQDTLSRQKRPFEPVYSGEARVYVCGVTVQGKPHIGHMRAAMVGDVTRRFLEFSGYKVTLLNNFTDIDDKIIARANEEGVDYKTIAERNIQAYLDAVKALNILPATRYPRATEHIPEIIDLIQKLVDRDAAYAAGGDVYYRVSRNPEYGKLSGRKIEELQVGARIEAGEAKEDPLDFTLWKGAKSGEPSWPSPWGDGRPGWHIECSAMSMRYLGETFDIHGGGIDLIFPHHENEIAQSESATGKPFARNWIHNGLVNLGGEKMSKSTEHFFLFEDVAREVEPAVLRYYLLSTHYRSPIEFSRERLDEAGKAFGRLLETRGRCLEVLGEAAPSSGGGILRNLRDGKEPEGLGDDVVSAGKAFLEAMNDDFNTARALGAVFDSCRATNRCIDEGAGSGPTSTGFGLVEEMFEVLGLWWPRETGPTVPDDVLDLARRRVEARAARDWGEADRLRDEIRKKGWVVADKGSEFTLRPA